MAVWMDPAWRGTESSGGFITEKQSDGSEYELNKAGTFYSPGFICTAAGSEYECLTNNSFVNFDLPITLSGTVASAILYTYIDSIELTGGTPTDIGIQVYFKEIYNDAVFPWVDLTKTDFSDTGWSLVGTLITSAISGVVGWVSINITSAVQHAIDEGWIGYGKNYLGLRFVPTKDYPDGWSYDSVQNPEESTYVTIRGACNQEYEFNDIGMPNYDEVISCPWISLDMVGDNPTQVIPGEWGQTGSNVLCVCSDVKRSVALAGVEGGRLYKTQNAGYSWVKIAEFGSAINAIYIDIKRNFMDFPSTAIVWVGLENGKVYKSIDSGILWNCSLICANAVNDIKGSNLASVKVAVASFNYLYITITGGDSWTLIDVNEV